MRTRFNEQWFFCKAAPGTAPNDVPETAWRRVSLPHDWLISQENDLYETADGLYRRILSVPAGEEGDVWQLRFDGVYMDCDVAVNGTVVRTHRYGYTAFDADLTGCLRAGDNELTVCVRHRSPNSRWYSGAGIFRDVTLGHWRKAHLVTDGVYLTPKRDGTRWTVDCSAEAAHADGETVTFVLTDPEGMETASVSATVKDGTARASMAVTSPRRWSAEEPTLYRMRVTLGEDALDIPLGFREIVFDPDRGFLLNGERVKLHGVCLHHDLGLFGSAFHPKAAERQLRLMQDMGVNALRTSHNPPASALLDLCDRLGILVVDEAFDMWQLPKTTYDYARFFDECVEEDVASWVRRDRNHPCVILWSIGNEIYDTFGNPKAPDITRMLRDNVRLHDPDGHAGVTIGSNYMPWEGAQKCADVLKLAGYNYGEKCYDSHHAEHPDWVIYGSETGSMLSSRGIYHFPYSAQILSDEDLQCSALGNSNTSWGATDLGRLLADDLNNPYTMGQFIWSGIDYIGEPTPYHTRSCYFGQADTACFPKDSFHRFRAAWTDRPMAHIGVTWDWNEGQMIDVPVMTNCARAELFLNGVSLGTRDVDQQDAERSLALWRIPFAPGVLQARCYDAAGHLRAQTMRATPGEPVRLHAEASGTSVLADGEDVCFLTVRALDEQGLPVENAADRVHVTVEGPAHLIGVDNGDSTDPDGYRQDSRRLFSGMLLAVVGMAKEPGAITVRFEAPGMQPAVCHLTAAAAERAADTVPPVIRHIEAADRREIRRIDLRAEGGTALTPEHPTVDLRVSCLPQATGEEPAFRIVNAAGITSPCAKTEPIPGGVRVTAQGDGAFCLRATVTNGDTHARILSQLEFTAEGFGQANLAPYGFVTAGLYDLHEGDIGAGNEQGIAFAREGESMVGFTGVDFGPVGSDEITVPIFALNGDAYDLRLWLGDPRDGGREIAVLHYQKPSVWNVYQNETWKLPERITGLQTLCFTLDKKVHMRGFSFRRLNRADLTLNPLEADEIYGDDFRKTERGVEGIGNNVTLVFRGMDFDAGGARTLCLRGATAIPACSVNVRLTDAAGEQTTQMCLFRRDAGETQRFGLNVPAGVCEAAFVFLPGAQFDFFGLRFEQEASV
ncbi:MAG: glycoside hydrolase family 2 protein [Clostridia bacterium]|nr:glycoside hydrolase family 2 protein [Clostridia bacterium]